MPQHFQHSKWIALAILVLLSALVASVPESPIFPANSADRQTSTKFPHSESPPAKKSTHPLDARKSEPVPISPWEKLRSESQVIATREERIEGKIRRLTLLRSKLRDPQIRMEEWLEREAGGAEKVSACSVAAADHLLVRPALGVDETRLRNFLESMGFGVERKLPKSGCFLVSLSGNDLDALEHALARILGADSPVGSAEPDYLAHAAAFPNDPGFENQDWLNNTGQQGGTDGADVDAIEAWKISVGSEAVKVGVIDSGIDLTHQDLRENIWTNPGEIAGNGLDDDQNGYVDDVHGWDFLGNDANRTDKSGHGTACAGIIGARGNNNIGGTGICPVVSLVPLKFLDDSGYGYNSDIVEAVAYATDIGVTATSNSWGGLPYSQLLFEEIERAGRAGILFVVSAGNDSKNLDRVSHFPTDYALENMIVVAASDDEDRLPPFSNFGATTVDLAAPGKGIYTTQLDNRYGYASGTSMSAPCVAGACALLKSINPKASGWQIKQEIVNSVDRLPAFEGRTLSGGRLNLFSAAKAFSGPTLRISELVFDDRKGGNGDGILNPGETISLSVRLANTGVQKAQQVQADLKATDPAVRISQGSAFYGSIRGNALGSASNGFRFHLPQDADTPTEVVLNLAIKDEAGSNWTQEFSVPVRTSQRVRGRVTARSDGRPIAGATISYRGPQSGSTRTESDGTYSMPLPDGVYALSANAPKYVEDQRKITIPSATSKVDFVLDEAALVNITTNLRVELAEGGTGRQTVTLRNSSDRELKFSFRPAVSFSAAAQTGSPAELPFWDGFEGETISGWDPGEDAEVRVDHETAAAGRGSLLIGARRTDYDPYVFRSFTKGSRPGYIGFSIQVGEKSAPAHFIVFGRRYRELINFSAVNGQFFVEGAESVFFQSEEWHRIEFRNIDWTEFRFDFYVDGRLISEKLSMGKPDSHESLERIGLGIEDVLYYRGLKTWWDEIAIADWPSDWMSVAQPVGVIPPHGSLQIPVSFHPNQLPPGSYQGLIEVASGAPNTPDLTIPVTLKVVESRNRRPVAKPLQVSTLEDAFEVVRLVGEDADAQPTKPLIVSLPLKGELYQTKDGATPGDPIKQVPAIVRNPEGKVIYLPSLNGSGDRFAEFTYRVRDYALESSPATVSIQVIPVNDAPVARPDAVEIHSPKAVEIEALANDFDVDADRLGITNVSQPLRGSASVQGDRLVYKPALQFTEGTDTFSYTITDPSGAESSASVSVNLFTGENWPTSFANMSRNSFSPTLIGSRQFKLLWKSERSADVPVTAEGKIFVLSGGGIAALDLASGVQIWSYPLKGDAYASGGVTYYRGKVYIQDLDYEWTDLVCLDAVDGRFNWQTRVTKNNGPADGAGNVAVFDDTIFVAGGPKHDTKNEPYGGFTAYDLQGNRRFGVDAEAFEAVTLGGGKLYTFEGGFLVARDSSGEMLWRTELKHSSDYDETVRPVYRNGIIYLSGYTRTCAVSVSSHEILWEADTSGPLSADDEVVVIGDRAYSAATGSKLQSYRKGFQIDSITSALVTPDAFIYSRDWDGIEVYDRSTGVRLQKIESPAEHLILSGSHLILSSDPGLACYLLESENQPPVANSESITFDEDTSKSFSLGGSDPEGATLRAVLTKLPKKGQLSVSNGSGTLVPVNRVPFLLAGVSREVTYTPEANEFGAEYSQVEFQLSDGVQLSEPGVITFNVTNVNDPPSAYGETFQTVANESLTRFRPEMNDRDLDGDELKIVEFTAGGHGSVRRNDDGSLTYRPEVGFVGEDRFKYTIDDGEGSRATATVTVVIVPEIPETWPSIHYSPSQTSYLPVSLGERPFKLLWSRRMNRTVHTPAVEGESVYVTSDVYWPYDGVSSVQSLDRFTGATVWTTHLNNENAETSAPTLMDGSLFVTESDGREYYGFLYGLDAVTGKIHWKVTTDSNFGPNATPLVVGETVYSASESRLTGYRTQDGRARFSTAQNGRVRPAFLDGSLYRLSGGEFSEIDRRTGLEIWRVEVGQIPDSDPVGSGAKIAIDGHFAYFIAGGRLQCLDLRSRAIVWTARGSFGASALAVANGIVYVGAGDDASAFVQAFSAKDGHFVGECELSDDSTYTDQASTIVVTNDLLLVSSWTHIDLIDRWKLQLRQKIPDGGEFSVAGGRLYIASENRIAVYSVPELGNSAQSPLSETVSTLEDSTVCITLQTADSDRDPIHFAVSRLPEEGQLFQTEDGKSPGEPILNVPVVVKDAQHRLLYRCRPNSGQKVVEGLQFQVGDGINPPQTASIRIAIEAENDPPIANQDLLTAKPGQILSPLPITVNDTDLDSDTLRIVHFSQPTSGGAIHRNEDGTLRFEPDPGFVEGLVKFQYTAADPSGNRTSSNVSIRVSDAPGSWSTFGNGPDHTGYTSDSIPRPPYVQAWSRRVGHLCNQVAVAQGKVFATRAILAYLGEDNVLALDEATGRKRWGNRLYRIDHISAPSYYDGTLYLQHDSAYDGEYGGCYAFNASTGATRWARQIGIFYHYDALLAPAVSELGAFFGRVAGAAWIGLETGSGNFRFNRTAPSYSPWVPSIYENRLFIFPQTGLMECNPQNGKPLWSVNVDRVLSGGSVAIANGAAYLVSDDGLVCVDLTKRKIRWRKIGDYAGTPAVNATRVFALERRNVQAHDCVTGRLAATYSATPKGDDLRGQPLLTNELVFASDGKFTYVWDRATQALLQRIDAGGELSVANSRLFVAGKRLTAFEPRRAVRFSPSGGSYSSPIVVTLSTQSEAGSIRYTTDGSAPTLQSSRLGPTGTLTIKTSTTLRAIALKGSEVSPIYTARYVLK